MEYLVQHLNNLGWCGSNGMGVTPLSFTEIDAYNRSTESFLNGEEVMILRKMSQRYVSELNDRNPAKQPPHGENIPLKNGFVEALKSMAVVKKI